MEIKGDLIKLAKEGRFDVIIHGCNCMCAMNKGIAKSIKDNFPGAYEVDKNTIKGDRNKLGTCTFFNTKFNNFNFIVVNAYTQYDYKGKGVLFNYEAFRNCLKWVKNNFKGKRIGLPKIGSKLARGDWSLISKIIDDELCDEDVTIVVFQK